MTQKRRKEEKIHEFMDGEKNRIYLRITRKSFHQKGHAGILDEINFP
jgi:hypothetical protein